MMADHCQAYTGHGVPLARGGRRLRHCKRVACTERTKTQQEMRYAVERTYRLCGQHAAQWDKAERGESYPPTLSADIR